MKTVQTIGIVGGGQLGRMLTQAAKPLGFRVVVLESSADCPAAQVGAKVIIGDLYDKKAIKKLASKTDVITIEIEHLNTAALGEVAQAGTPVHPSPTTIAMIQDKFLQKQFLAKNGIAVAQFKEVKDAEHAKEIFKAFNNRMILKAKHGAYDGRGNAIIKNPKQLEEGLKKLESRELYGEELVDFTKELSVIVARDVNGAIAVYDVVEMNHERSICLEVLAPARITSGSAAKAIQLARKTAEHLKGAGVFAIEMFLLKNGEVLVNEIAPRVHNSGHHTLDAAQTSQFEQHIRGITGLPLGSTKLISPAVMINILGTYNGLAEFDFKKALELKNVHCHWYGKSPVKIDRKMGHITALDAKVESALKYARKARKAVKV